MSRLNRVISIVSFAVAFVVLFLLASIVSHLGPVEFIVVIAVAILLGMSSGVRCAVCCARPARPSS
jgi:hypothetical protein